VEGGEIAKHGFIVRGRVERSLNAACVSFRLDDFEPLDRGKMPQIKGGYCMARMNSRCRENQIVRADHPAAGLKLGPKARVFEGRIFAVGHDAKTLKYPLKKQPTLGLMNAGRP